MFRKRLNNQMAAVRLQVNPSFYAKFSKNSLVSSPKTYNKYIVSTTYCIAHHNAEMCFLSNCTYHILLLGKVEMFLQKQDRFCFTNQHLSCLYTFPKYRFRGNTVVKIGQVFDFVERTLFFN